MTFLRRDCSLGARSGSPVTASCSNQYRDPLAVGMNLLALFFHFSHRSNIWPKVGHLFNFRGESLNALQALLNFHGDLRAYHLITSL